MPGSLDCGRRHIPNVRADIPGERIKGQSPIELKAGTVRIDDLDAGVAVIPLGGEDLDLNVGMLEGLSAHIRLIGENEEPQAAGGLTFRGDRLRTGDDPDTGNGTEVPHPPVAEHDSAFRLGAHCANLAGHAVGVVVGHRAHVVLKRKPACCPGAGTASTAAGSLTCMNERCERHRE